MISEKLCVLDLVGRIGKVNVVWERREAMGVDYEKAVMQDHDFWDPMLNAEYAMALGWTRLGNA